MPVFRDLLFARLRVLAVPARGGVRIHAPRKKGEGREAITTSLPKPPIPPSGHLEEGNPLISAEEEIRVNEEHGTFPTIRDLVEDRLADGAVGPAKEHLLVRAGCRARLADWDAYVKAMQAAVRAATAR